MGFAQVLRDKPELLKEDKGKRYAENIIVGQPVTLGVECASRASAVATRRPGCSR